MHGLVSKVVRDDELEAEVSYFKYSIIGQLYLLLKLKF